jgi:hypothetical protein
MVLYSTEYFLSGVRWQQCHRAWLRNEVARRYGYYNYEWSYKCSRRSLLKRYKATRNFHLCHPFYRYTNFTLVSNSIQTEMKRFLRNLIYLFICLIHVLWFRSHFACTGFYVSMFAFVVGRKTFSKILMPRPRIVVGTCIQTFRMLLRVWLILYYSIRTTLRFIAFRV